MDGVPRSFIPVKKKLERAGYTFNQRTADDPAEWVVEGANADGTWYVGQRNRSLTYCWVDVITGAHTHWKHNKGPESLDALIAEIEGG